MFSQSQRYYDAIYSGKDYAAEAGQLKALIAAHKRSDGNTWLDIACGTGGHIPYLRDAFAYEGLDLDPEMLALARQRFPDVVFHQGDMVDFALGRQFDVVSCLFSSIGATRTPPRLRQAIAAMAAHLRPGGVLLVGSFLTPQEWIPGHPHAMFVDQPDLKLARLNVSGVAGEGNIAVLDFHYLVATPEGVEQFTEHHELGLFTEEEYRAAFTQAGLEVLYDREWLGGRGMYIGTRSSRES
ncbi:MAG TPA: class I SAM-dependent methyltransferase [Ktedonobacterales bacterium]|nr:class I SAM-dependent methyltransferase [Ktedonobacterales bacterium]